MKQQAREERALKQAEQERLNKVCLDVLLSDVQRITRYVTSGTKQAVFTSHP